MTPAPIFLAAALAHTGAQPDPAAWLRDAHAAETAGLDFVTFEPGPLDPLLLAARLAAQTERIGILPVAATTTTEPFHTSTALATIDYVSRGRAGWVATTQTPAEAAGLVTWELPSDIVADARDHIDTVRALWDSWEAGAEIRDTATDRFIDAALVHHIDHTGPTFSVRGPSITPRPPQGHPVIAVRAGASGATIADGRADLLFTDDPGAAAPPGVLQLLEHTVAAATTPTTDALRSLIDDAAAHGVAGIVFHTAELQPVLDALAPLLTGRTPHSGATLRERLGLAPAPNRFAAAR